MTLKDKSKLILKFSDNSDNFSINTQTYKNIPCNGDIFRIYWLAYNYDLLKHKTDILEAILLKWIKEGHIKIKIKNFLNRKTIIIFKEKTPFLEDQLESILYKYMYESSCEGILEIKKFKKWCNENSVRILSWFDMTLNSITSQLINDGKIVKKEENCQIYYEVDSSLKDEIIKIKGFIKFLKQLNGEQLTIDVMLYEDYLVYEKLFGIKNKTLKKAGKLYSEEYINKYKNIKNINNIIPNNVKKSKKYISNSLIFRYDSSLYDVVSNSSNNK